MIVVSRTIAEILITLTIGLLLISISWFRISNAETDEAGKTGLIFNC